MAEVSGSELNRGMNLSIHEAACLCSRCSLPAYFDLGDFFLSNNVSNKMRIIQFTSVILQCCYRCRHRIVVHGSE